MMSMLIFAGQKSMVRSLSQLGKKIVPMAIRGIIYFALLSVANIPSSNAASSDLVDDAIHHIEAGETGQGMSELDTVILSGALPKERQALAYFVRGEMRRRAQQYETAIKDLSTSLSLNNTFKTHEARAYAFGAIGDFRSEISDWDIVLQQSKSNLDALDWRARAYVFLGNFDQAIAGFNQVLSIDPNNIFALSSQSLIALTQRRFSDALSFIERAEQVAPNDPGIMGRRAEYYASTGDFDRAIPAFDKAVRLQPDDPQLLFRRLDVLRRTGAFTRAEADCRALSSIEPSQAYPTLRSETAISCAEIKLDEGKYDEAIVGYTRAITTQLKPNGRPYALRGLAYAHNGQMPAALADLNQAAAIGPPSAGTYLGRGILLKAAGQLPAAHQAFEVALTLPADENQGMILLWLTMSGGTGIPDRVVQLAKSKSPIDRLLWPWPVVEMSAGLLPSAQVIAISKRDNASAQGYEQNCSLPFFSAAIDKARTPAAKFDRAAYGATMRRLIDVCPPGSIENLGARLEAAQVSRP